QRVAGRGGEVRPSRRNLFNKKLPVSGFQFPNVTRCKVANQTPVVIVECDGCRPNVVGVALSARRLPLGFLNVPMGVVLEAELRLRWAILAPHLISKLFSNLARLKTA